MTALEQTLDIDGARYTVRKMNTRGYLALIDLLSQRPEPLAEVIEAARAGRHADASRALAPALAELANIVLAHCVRPTPDTNALPPSDACRLLAAARDLNPLVEIAEELNRFFEVFAPVARQAREAFHAETDGSG